MLMRLIRRARYWLRSPPQCRRTGGGDGVPPIAGRSGGLRQRDAGARGRAPRLDVAVDRRCLAGRPLHDPVDAPPAGIRGGGDRHRCARNRRDDLRLRPARRAHGEEPAGRDRPIGSSGSAIPAFSYPIFAQVRDRLPVFDGVFGWNVDRAYVDWTGSHGELARPTCSKPPCDFFSTLRVTADGRPDVRRRIERTPRSRSSATRHGSGTSPPIRWPSDAAFASATFPNDRRRDAAGILRRHARPRA